MTNRILRAAAFAIFEDFRKCLKANREWKATNCNYPEEDKLLSDSLNVWKDLLNGEIQKLKQCSKLHYNGSKMYCSYAREYELHTTKVWRALTDKDLYNVLTKAEKAEEAFYEIGWIIGAGKELNEEQIKKYSFLLTEEFETWEKKRTSKKTTYKTSYKTKEYKKSEGKGALDAKGYCCAVMARIRDHMIKREGITDYKNDNSKIGLARKKAVRGLMAYAKTQDTNKLNNFKNLVAQGLYSEEFKEWTELYEELKELKREFTEEKTE